jgi:hypothetical protein
MAGYRKLAGNVGEILNYKYANHEKDNPTDRMHHPGLEAASPMPPGRRVMK